MKVPVLLWFVLLFAAGCGEYEFAETPEPELPPGPLRWIDADPAWSPDGRRIVFTRGDTKILSDGFKIRWVDVETGRERALTRGAGHFDRDPDWAPREDMIAFVRSSDSLFCNEDDAIYIVPVAGGHARRVAQGCAPEWAPKGSRLAFLTGSVLTVARPGRSGTKAVARGVSFSYDWSPDGSKLAYEGNNELWTVGADGRGRRRLTRRGYARVAHGPIWSPDGALILHDRYISSDLGLWVMHPDGSGAKKIASGEIGDRGWSPDGSRVVFSSEDGLFVADRDGKNERRLPDTYAESFGGWSPDGRRIALGGNTAGTLSPDPYPILVIDVETARLTRATQRPR